MTACTKQITGRNDHDVFVSVHLATALAGVPRAPSERRLVETSVQAVIQFVYYLFGTPSGNGGPTATKHLYVQPKYIIGYISYNV